jgi:hypothetical protein
MKVMHSSETSGINKPANEGNNTEDLNSQQCCRNLKLQLHYKEKMGITVPMAADLLLCNLLFTCNNLFVSAILDVHEEIFSRNIHGNQDMIGHDKHRCLRHFCG